jgi:hypothetical protein
MKQKIKVSTFKGVEMKKLILNLVIMCSFSQVAFGAAVATPPQTMEEYNQGVFLVPESDKGQTVPTKHNLQKVLSLIHQLRKTILDASKKYSIPAIDIAAAIAGEHALNVDVKDTLQDYHLTMIQYLPKWMTRYDKASTNLFEMTNLPEFARCQERKSDYDYWSCIMLVWNDIPKYGGEQSPSGSITIYWSFLNKYFNPAGMGSTFGLGQMSPLRAIMVSDVVARKMPALRLNFRTNGDYQSIYETVMDPEKVIYFIAATLQVQRLAYIYIAHFDIANNPEITSTLYNLGNEKINAAELYQKNQDMFQKGGHRIRYPQPNELGRWVLQNVDAIESALH